MLANIFGGGGKGSRKDDSSSSEQQGSGSAPGDIQSAHRPQDGELDEIFADRSRFAKFSPPTKGYHSSMKQSRFNINSKMRETDTRLQQIPYHIQLDKSKRKYICTYFIDQAGTFPLSLKESSLPDPNSLVYNGKRITTPPVFLIDSNGNAFIKASSRGMISFDCYYNQNISAVGPSQDDSRDIILEDLSESTQQLLQKLKGQMNGGMTASQAARQIAKYICANKNYPQQKTFQGTHRKNATPTNYIANLDKLYKELDCHDSNTLFVGLCRKIGIPARSVPGYLVKELIDGQSFLGKSNGHRWSQIWDNQIGKRVMVDSTPALKSDGTKSEQNMDDDVIGGQEGEGGSGKDETGEGSGSGGSGSSGKSKEQLQSEGEQSMDDTSLLQQKEKVLETLDKLKNAQSKEEIRDILDKSGLQGDAKDKMQDESADEIQKYNEEELAQTREEIKKAIEGLDQDKLDELLEKSTLDDNYKEQLKSEVYSSKLKISDDSKRMRLNDMSALGFQSHEKHLFDIRRGIVLEAEQGGTVQQQIAIMNDMMPREYHSKLDKTQFVQRGKMNMPGLVRGVVTDDPRMYYGTSTHTIPKKKLNLVEVFGIDVSPDMGEIEDPGSALREAVKAFYIESKKLENFDVKLALFMFDARVGQVMNFGQKFNDASFNVPSKLMRVIADKQLYTNISGTLKAGVSAIEELLSKQQTNPDDKPYGTITLFTNGIITSGNDANYINQVTRKFRQQGFGITGCYIGDMRKWRRKNDTMEQYRQGLQACFGTGAFDTILASDYKQFAAKQQQNNQRAQIIQRYAK